MLIEGSAVKDKFGNIYYVSYYNQKDDELYVIPKYLKKGNSYVKIINKELLNDLLNKVDYKLICYSKFLKRRTFILPLEVIEVYYDPLIRIKEIIYNPTDDHEKKIASFINDIINGGFFDLEKVGIEGSTLVSLHNKSSDIDLIYYGEYKENLYNTLLNLRKKGTTNPIEGMELKKLYYEREFHRYFSYEMFKKIEQRKLCEGKYRNTQYSVKILNRSIIGDEIKSNKYKTDIVEVIDATYNYLFPSIYKVKSLRNGEEYEIINFRIRYLEMLKEKDKAKIKGLLEVSEKGKRFILTERDSYIKPII